jgi:hypothetical protein
LNALAESFVDSFKTELIRDRVWRTRVDLELAVVEYVAWFNHRRLHSSIGDVPPSEYEANHHSSLVAVRAGIRSGRQQLGRGMNASRLGLSDPRCSTFTHTYIIGLHNH